jgi:hypothetical protein
MTLYCGVGLIAPFLSFAITFVQYLVLVICLIVHMSVSVSVMADPFCHILM